LTAVDLFAGAGGFSTGAFMAGCHVAWAANHWRDAVDYHKINHPKTLHTCQDLKQADWTALPDHDLLLASPCCQGHSHARGKDRPHHDAARATAWAVIDALETKRTPLALIENVKAFTDWVLYPSWKDALHRLGYSVGEHIVNAADFGIPQSRERAFLVLTRTKAPLQLSFEKRPHVSVDSIIQWDRGHWESIHNTRSPLTPLQAKAAVQLNEADGYRGRGIFAYYSSERRTPRGRRLSRPMGTVTTKARFAVVKDETMRMVNSREYLLAMGFPSSYILPPDEALAIHFLGNAVCPGVAKAFIEKLVEAA
jgi:DNA (cytosine-5)-methyltransferase 1